MTSTLLDSELERLDIETADFLLEMDNGKDPNEHGYEYIAFYRKKNGEYFLRIVDRHTDHELSRVTIHTFEEEDLAKKYCAEILLVKEDYEKVFGTLDNPYLYFRP